MRQKRRVEFEDLIGQIYEAGLSAESWVVLLENLADRLGAPTASSFWFDKKSGMINLQRSDTFNIDSDHIRQYAVNFVHKDVRAEYAAKASVGSLVTDADIAVDFAKSHPEIHSAAQRFSMDGWLCLVIENHPSLLVAESFYFGDREGPHDRETRRLLRSLQGHLRRAVRLASHVAENRKVGLAYEEIFDRLNCGAVLLDEHARVVRMNVAAERLVGPENGLLYTQNTILAVRASDNRVLSKAIAGALSSSPSARDEGGPIVIERPSGDSPLVLTVMPLTRRAIDEVPHHWMAPTRQVLITIAETEPHSDIDRVKVILRFTTSEADIAVRLAQGHTVEQIKAARGVSEETVRSQLKTMFNKLSVSSQSQLVSRVWNASRIVVDSHD